MILSISSDLKDNVKESEVNVEYDEEESTSCISEYNENNFDGEIDYRTQNW